MQEQELIPNLFRTEYSKIIAVLCKSFGIAHVEIAEDIASDTFVAATELWGLKGIPENPVAWLYTVAKNKTKNYLKRDALFAQKISTQIVNSGAITTPSLEINLTPEYIADSQLAMMFTVCDPAISTEAQIALALHLLCGFGTQEIADAFLTNKEVIYKRLQRAKEKLRSANLKIETPSAQQMDARLDRVLRTIYLLFNEGYYSTSDNTILKKDLCAEAMRLNALLLENPGTNTPSANALMALMCFHASRFESRIAANGATILYEDQDPKLWDVVLVQKGIYYLNQSAQGLKAGKYHLEAGIAYWHTKQEDDPEKWESILQLYNRLLFIEYSPVAALNRTFALAKANGKEEAIVEAEKLKLTDNQFYYMLLGSLYTGKDNEVARNHFEKALQLAKSEADKLIIREKIEGLKEVV